MSLRPVDRKQHEDPYRGTVDEQVRAFYSRQGLAPERAKALIAGARRRRLARRRRRLVAVAAIVVVFAGVLLTRAVLRDRALGDRVAAEVVMGHKKDLDVEIATSDPAELAEALDKLTFPLRVPDRLGTLDGGTEPSHEMGLELVGGRYCSIQAQLAALLKFRDAHGRPASLYVTGLSSELDALPGVQRSVDGVEVDIWSERDLLFALVRDAIPRSP